MELRLKPGYNTSIPKSKLPTYYYDPNIEKGLLGGANYYDLITCPVTLTKVSIKSLQGINILNKYLKKLSNNN